MAKDFKIEKTIDRDGVEHVVVVPIVSGLTEDKKSNRKKHDSD